MINKRQGVRVKNLYLAENGINSFKLCLTEQNKFKKCLYLAF